MVIWVIFWLVTAVVPQILFYYYHRISVKSPEMAVQPVLFLVDHWFSDLAERFVSLSNARGHGVEAINALAMRQNNQNAVETDGDLRNELRTWLSVFPECRGIYFISRQKIVRVDSGPLHTWDRTAELGKIFHEWEKVSQEVEPYRWLALDPSSSRELLCSIALPLHVNDHDKKEAAMIALEVDFTPLCRMAVEMAEKYELIENKSTIALVNKYGQSTDALQTGGIHLWGPSKNATLPVEEKHFVRFPLTNAPFEIVWEGAVGGPSWYPLAAAMFSLLGLLGFAILILRYGQGIESSSHSTTAPQDEPDARRPFEPDKTLPTPSPIQRTYTAVRLYSAQTTVLVADDNSENRNHCASLLAELGFTIETAVDGREVFDKFAATPDRFSIIFMDLEMPDMNGPAAAKAIRRWENQHRYGGFRIPIIGMGARKTGSVPEINGYTAKPLTQDTLATILSQFMAAVE